MKKVIILIPPSEGKAPDGTGKTLEEIGAPKQSVHMIQRLQNYDGDMEKLLGVKGNALVKATSANNLLLCSPTLPAIKRYTGVVYDALDYPTLSKEGKSFCDSHVRIISGLFGLISPKERIPDYKLKIEKLNAADYWCPIIKERLEGCTIIDLLPHAHKKAVGILNRIEVDFIIEKAGKRTPAGHHGKHIKGRFIRFLCEKQITDPKDFKRFKEEGFAWDGKNFILNT
ncbi:YaaA family protein [Candidatus Woesearchaeota archaeon]|nr:YaaA family protein [Candidatus Woesearchaeota archaeon]